MNQNEKAAFKIDKFVKKFKKKNKNIDEIVGSPEIMQYMNRFKSIMDNSVEGELEYLISKYDSFYEFAKFLENFAGAIKAGTFNDLL